MQSKNNSIEITEIWTQYTTEQEVSSKGVCYLYYSRLKQISLSPLQIAVEEELFLSLEEE